MWMGHASSTYFRQSTVGSGQWTVKKSLDYRVKGRENVKLSTNHCRLTTDHCPLKKAEASHEAPAFFIQLRRLLLISHCFHRLDRTLDAWKNFFDQGRCVWKW
jgi:hypothetical protein